MSSPTEQTRAIATRSTQLAFTIREEMSLTSVADAFYKSGLFKDVRDAGQAMVKILAGREMGLEPVESMMSLYLVGGRLAMYAEAMGAKIKASGTHRYKVLEHTDESCSILFYERVDGAWEECGPPSVFTVADAKRAGTQNMGKFPRNMLFARALSNGFKWYCPHLKVAGLASVEELDDLPPATGPSKGAQALDAALSSPKPVEQAPEPAPEKPETPKPSPKPQATPQPTLEAYRALCAAYKDHLGEEVYHGVLGGKSNEVAPEDWQGALDALQAACVAQAPPGAPFPATRHLLEAQALKKPEVLEGIEGYEEAMNAPDGLRMAYLGDAALDKTLVAPMRVYHARLSEMAWEQDAAAGDLFSQ
ncbi:MAG: hypothetical protein ABIL09_28450 [Gemmatimonadota bacterium]